MNYSNKKKPFISVITPVKNGGKTLKNTIESIKRQSFKNYEYIIIDGLSNDNTEEIINSNKKYINIYIREKDEGIYDAMNKGIKLASGEYISIINSDDYLNSNAFGKVYQESQNYKKDVVFYSDMNVFYKDKKNEVLVKGNISPNLIQSGGLSINHPTIFIPNLIYKKYGVFKKDFKCSADRELIMRLLKKKVKFKKLNLVLASFSLGGTTSKYSFKFCLSLLVSGFVDIDEFVCVFSAFPPNGESLSNILYFTIIGLIK